MTELLEQEMESSMQMVIFGGFNGKRACISSVLQT